MADEGCGKLSVLGKVVDLLILCITSLTFGGQRWSSSWLELWGADLPKIEVPAKLWPSG